MVTISVFVLTTNADSITYELTEGKIKAALEDQKKLLSPEDMIIDSEEKLASIQKKINDLGKNLDDSEGELSKWGQYSFIIETNLSDMYAILDFLQKGKISYAEATARMLKPYNEIQNLK
jgi:hypothetical protein